MVLPPLHVSGAKILDNLNNPVYLAGINYETWLYKQNGVTDPNENPNGWFVKQGHIWNWWTDAATSWDVSTQAGIDTENAVRAHFRQMKTVWGLNCCRMHFCIEPWINDSARTEVNKYRRHLYRCAEIASEEGIYIVYDVWSYKQHNPNQPAYPFYPYESYAPPSFDENAFANWWGEVAAYFANAPNVIFDIYNEPHEGAPAHGEYTVANMTHWQQIFNKAIASIRSTSQNLIVAEFGFGPDGWYNPPVGLTVFYNYPLTGTNLVYSTHLYRHYDHLGTDRPFDKPTLIQRLQACSIVGPNSPTEKGIAPVFIGEIGAFATEYNDHVAFRNIMDVFTADGIHYAGFEWWVDGREYSMLLNQAMIAPPNEAGLILQDAAINPKMNLNVAVNPAIPARASVDGTEWTNMPFKTQAAKGTHLVEVDEYVTS